MRQSTSLVTKYKLCPLDIRMLLLSSRAGPEGIPVYMVAERLSVAQMTCWNSTRKLRRSGLVVIPENISRLGSLTRRGQGVLQAAHEEGLCDAP